MMLISKTPPPNYDEIVTYFPWVKGREGVLFAYGRVIHVPWGDPSRITEDFIVHESVHSRQQGDDPRAWWDEYLLSPEFRLSQELEAYAAQYAHLAATVNRAERRTALDAFAQTLAGSLYGRLVSKSDAKASIRELALSA